MHRGTVIIAQDEAAGDFYLGLEPVHALMKRPYFQSSMLLRQH